MHVVKPENKSDTVLFWNDAGGACIDFQYSCNQYDWIVVLEKLAAVIANSVPVYGNQEHSLEKSARCLDIGSGFLHNLRDLINILRWKHQVLSKWECVEPDQELTKLIRTKTLSPVPKPLGINNIHSELGAVKGDYFDVILFMHSCYYIDEFTTYLLRIRRKFPKATIIILRVAEHSPFYLFHEHIPQNGSYGCFSKIGFKVTSELSEVGIDIPKGFLESEDYLREMYSFFSRRNANGIVFEEFREKFLRVYSKKINLVDEILTLR